MAIIAEVDDAEVTYEGEPATIAEVDDAQSQVKRFLENTPPTEDDSLGYGLFYGRHLTDDEFRMAVNTKSVRDMLVYLTEHSANIKLKAPLPPINGPYAPSNFSTDFTSSWVCFEDDLAATDALWTETRRLMDEQSFNRPDCVAILKSDNFEECLAAYVQINEGMVAINRNCVLLLSKNKELINAVSFLDYTLQTVAKDVSSKFPTMGQTLEKFTTYSSSICNDQDLFLYSCDGLSEYSYLDARDIYRHMKEHFPEQAAALKPPVSQGDMVGQYEEMAR